MKLMVASDIHGSAHCCKELLEAYEREKPQRLVLLGDLLYHGPRNELPSGYAPKEVIALLNGKKEELLCVRGNCDCEVDQMVLEFPMLADYAYLYVDGIELYITHGHLQNPATPPFLKTGSILLNGHTHVPKCQEYKDFIYMNPGSVSIPKEGSKCSYMVYEDRHFEWKTLGGNTYMEYKYC